MDVAGFESVSLARGMRHPRFGAGVKGVGTESGDALYSLLLWECLLSPPAPCLVWPLSSEAIRNRLSREDLVCVFCPLSSHLGVGN